MLILDVREMNSILKTSDKYALKKCLRILSTCRRCLKKLEKKLIIINSYLEMN
jgi:hypothetical protein